ncbi:MAG: DUF4367 domain-containing protein [Lachnospiraceae bacterium]|nr:DUF4367 domain-containing protein [Lachnospiraceae bacterium]
MVMNNKMTKNSLKFKEQLSEELLREAVSELYEKELSEINEYKMEEDEFSVSADFCGKIDKLGRRILRKKAKKKLIPYGLGVLICIIALSAMLYPERIARASHSVLSWFQDHASIQFKKQNENCNIAAYVLTYVPEGFTLLEEQQGGKSGFSIYVNSENEMLSFNYAPSDASINVNSENITYEEIKTEDGRMSFYFVSHGNIKETSFIWLSDDETTMFTINVDGEVNVEEMLKLREGVMAK